MRHVPHSARLRYCYNAHLMFVAAVMAQHTTLHLLVYSGVLHVLSILQCKSVMTAFNCQILARIPIPQLP